MYATVQCGKLLLNSATRTGYISLLARHYKATAAPTYRLTQHDSGKTFGREHPQTATSVLTRLSKMNQTTPIRSYSFENTKVTALTLIKDLKNLKDSPGPALVLGASGLIPFISAPMYMILSGTCAPSLAYAQCVYGACILSFIGGVRWGVTLPNDGVIKPNWVNLGYSVTPPLIAWIALLFPTTLGLATLMVGLGGAAYMDISMWGYPTWFKAMRFVLTLTAMLSLWTTILLTYTLKDSKKKSDSSKTKETKEKAPAPIVTQPSPVSEVADVEPRSEEEEEECWWLEDIEDPIEEFISCNDD